MGLSTDWNAARQLAGSWLRRMTGWGLDEVGGGYGEADNALSVYPFAWLLEEAVLHGLRIGRGELHRIIEEARDQEETGREKLHNSLSIWWWPLELVPALNSARPPLHRRGLLGMHIPAGGRRWIEPGSKVHQSAIARMNKDPTYRPANLPLDFEVVGYGRAQPLDAAIEETAASAEIEGGAGGG